MCPDDRRAAIEGDFLARDGAELLGDALRRVVLRVVYAAPQEQAAEAVAAALASAYVETCHVEESHT